MTPDPAAPVQTPVSSDLLSRIKRHWHLMALAVEELPAGPEATDLTIAVSNLREVVQKVPGCADFWRHPFDQTPEADMEPSGDSRIPWTIRELAERGDPGALSLLVDPPDPPGFGEY